MVTTRSKERSQFRKSTGAVEPNTGQKRSHGQASEANLNKTEPKKQRTDRKGPKQRGEYGEENSKGLKLESVKDGKKTVKGHNQKVDALLKQYEDLPLWKTNLEEPGKAKPATLLGLLLNAILSSTRVSHTIAAKTTDLVIDAGYHKLDVLKKSSWQERTEVLTEGGYTHYR